MAISETNYGLIRKATGVAAFERIPVPTLPDDYLLIRVVTVAVNPTDWTTLDAPGDEASQEARRSSELRHDDRVHTAASDAIARDALVPTRCVVAAFSTEAEHDGRESRRGGIGDSDGFSREGWSHQGWEEIAEPERISSSRRRGGRRIARLLRRE